MFHFYCIFHKKFLQANSDDPDQMPHSAASELGLHCLHMSLNWVYILKNVDGTKISLNETKLPPVVSLVI